MMFYVAIDACVEAASVTESEIVDDALIRRLSSLINGPLKDIKAKKGMKDFRVIVSELNTEATMANNELHARVIIQPYSYAEAVILNFVATPAGVSIDEMAV
jgi:hypothetical protein